MRAAVSWYPSGRNRVRERVDEQKVDQSWSVVFSIRTTLDQSPWTKADPMAAKLEFIGDAEKATLFQLYNQWSSNVRVNQTGFDRRCTRACPGHISTCRASRFRLHRTSRSSRGALRRYSEAISFVCAPKETGQLLLDRCERPAERRNVSNLGPAENLTKGSPAQRCFLPLRVRRKHCGFI